MAKRRDKGDGGVYQRHTKDCPPPGDEGERPKHTCKGRWVAAFEGGYVGDKRVRRTVTAATKRELEPKLRKLREEVEAKVDQGDVTVSAWTATWIGRLPGKGRAPRTVTGYQSNLDTWVTPHLGRVRLIDLRPSDVSGVLDAMRQQGKSEGTILQVYALLHAAMGAAAKERRVIENVVSRVDRPTPSKVKPPALTPEQGAALMAMQWPADLAARWWVALLAGLRQGEALGLRWEDVHLDDAEPWIWVHQVAQPRKGEGMVIKPVPKGNRPRGVALRHEVADALRRHRQDGAVGYVWGAEQIVRPEWDYRLWQDALRTAGLPAVTLHSARATAETWLDMLGVPPRTVSDMLGHAQLAMTTHYHRGTVATQAAGLAQARPSLGA